jgi:hypothetical protein
VQDHEIDLLSIVRGAVTAPAGCGKTQLIIDALVRHPGPKPILVLTHTNAGVAALRGRLERASVPSRVYRLATIDGWSMRLVRTFPARSACDLGVLDLKSPARDYPAIREGATNILAGHHIADVLAASYASLIIDEYQDCSDVQHAMMTHVTATLRTAILGDPMQAIFGFAGNRLARWDDVCAHFPVVVELSTPWRWNNANAGPLGQWLLGVRRSLLEGQPIDLRTAPAGVSWFAMDGGLDDHRKRVGAASVPLDGNSKALIICDSKKPDRQRRFASLIPGGVTVEAVDLRDLVSFASRLDLAQPSALQEVVEFAEAVMTNVGAQNLLQRIQSLRRGTARKSPNEVEAAALSFCEAPSYAGAASLLVEINKEAEVRAHRPTILRAAVRALQLCKNGDRSALNDAAIQMREDGRLTGRPLSRRTVGSTLLLKGLEADIAVVLDADQLDAKDLYVAMTRGSKGLIVCSKHPILVRPAQRSDRG